VERRREGRRQWYRARPEALGPLARALEEMWFGRLSELKALAEAEQVKIDADQRKVVRAGRGGGKKKTVREALREAGPTKPNPARSTGHDKDSGLLSGPHARRGRRRQR
jgi:hypothetical protein